MIKAGDGEDTQDGRSADDQKILPAFGLGPFVRADERVKAGRVAELGPAHVDYQRSVPARGGLEQNRPQPGGVGDIDLIACRHHGNARDYLDREPGIRHPRHPLR